MSYHFSLGRRFHGDNVLRHQNSHSALTSTSPNLPKLHATATYRAKQWDGLAGRQLPAAYDSCARTTSGDLARVVQVPVTSFNNNSSSSSNEAISSQAGLYLSGCRGFDPVNETADPSNDSNNYRC